MKRMIDDEENRSGKKQHVEEVESSVSLSKGKPQNHFEFVAELNYSILGIIMSFLKPHDIFACISTCKQWQQEIDDPILWKKITERDFGPFVARMESTVADINGTQVNYRSIAKGLTSIKPLCRKAENDSAPTLVLGDILVIVHIRDKESGNLVHWYFKNLQDLTRLSSRHYKLSFIAHESAPLLQPAQLCGEFRDHFDSRFEECWRLPERVADTLCVSVRLWHMGKQQAICLCHNAPPDEVSGFKTLHNTMPLNPAGCTNPGEDLLLCWVNCLIVATYPPSYDNRAANYDHDDWEKIQYSIGSLELGISTWHPNTFLDSASDIFRWWNALDWN